MRNSVGPMSLKYIVNILITSKYFYLLLEDLFQNSYKLLLNLHHRTTKKLNIIILPVIVMGNREFIVYFLFVIASFKCTVLINHMLDSKYKKKLLDLLI